MIRIIILFLMIVFVPITSPAKDFMVDFVAENYKEKMIVGGGEVKVTHSWQVKTEFGNKLLVLVGDDEDYRKWLREYRKDHRLFIVKIPAEGEDMFRYDLAVSVSVQQVYPVSGDQWKCEKCRSGQPPKQGTSSQVKTSVPTPTPEPPPAAAK